MNIKFDCPFYEFEKMKAKIDECLKNKRKINFFGIEYFVKGFCWGTDKGWVKAELEVYELEEVGMNEHSNKIHNLEINKDATLLDMMKKLGEEIDEVYKAVNNLDEDNFIEELLDVVQVCYGLAYTRNINLDDYIKQHNEKLLSRGHKFID